MTRHLVLTVDCDDADAPLVIGMLTRTLELLADDFQTHTPLMDAPEAVAWEFDG